MGSKAPGSPACFVPDDLKAKYARLTTEPPPLPPYDPVRSLAMIAWGVFALFAAVYLAVKWF